jgi:hypothetical protein
VVEVAESESKEKLELSFCGFCFIQTSWSALVRSFLFLLLVLIVGRRGGGGVATDFLNIG